ncbi:MAG: lipid-A-disaccharide synthase [Gammaproteobacteria bacterium]
MHFALVAGELSGDLLGAALIRALRARFPTARFSGVAGPQMRAEGCEAIASIDALSLMGIAEVLPALPRLLRLRAQLVARFTRERPDCVIGIDAPDFNLGLERRLRQRGLRTVHVVSPSVWAWRAGRVHGIVRSVDLLLCLLPFEPACYAGHALRAEFIGHPLADELQPGPAQPARQALGLPATGPLLAVLPGSRAGELKYLAAPFAQAVAALHRARPGLQVVSPLARPGLRAPLQAAMHRYAPDVPWTLVEGRAREAMQAADAVLLASGTATLECLLLGRPMVVGYRTNALTAWLLLRAGMLKTRHVSLPNLLCDAAVVPERLQDRLDPQRLADDLQALLEPGAARRAQLDAFDRVREVLKADAGARAADAIARLLGT